MSGQHRRERGSELGETGGLGPAFLSVTDGPMFTPCSWSDLNAEFLREEESYFFSPAVNSGSILC